MQPWADAASSAVILQLTLPRSQQQLGRCLKLFQLTAQMQKNLRLQEGNMLHLVSGKSIWYSCIMLQALIIINKSNRHPNLVKIEQCKPDQSTYIASMHLSSVLRQDC